MGLGWILLFSKSSNDRTVEVELAERPTVSWDAFLRNFLKGSSWFSRNFQGFSGWCFCKIRDPLKLSICVWNLWCEFRWEKTFLQFKTCPSQVIYGRKRQFLIAWRKTHPQLDRRKNWNRNKTSLGASSGWMGGKWQHHNDLTSDVLSLRVVDHEDSHQIDQSRNHDCGNYDSTSKVDLLEVVLFSGFLAILLATKSLVISFFSW